MIQATSFISGEFEHCFSARGEAQWAGDNTISSSNNKLNSRTNRIELHTKVAQHRGRNAPVLTRKAEQEVFSADVIVLEALSLLPRKSQDPSGTHSERLKPVPVILTEYAKRLNEILFLWTKFLYFIVVILDRFRLLFTWFVPALLLFTLAIPLRL